MPPQNPTRPKASARSAPPWPTTIDEIRAWVDRRRQVLEGLDPKQLAMLDELLGGVDQRDGEIAELEAKLDIALLEAKRLTVRLTALQTQARNLAEGLAKCIP